MDVASYGSWLKRLETNMGMETDGEYAQTKSWREFSWSQILLLRLIEIDLGRQNDVQHMTKSWREFSWSQILLLRLIEIDLGGQDDVQRMMKNRPDHVGEDEEGHPGKVLSTRCRKTCTHGEQGSAADKHGTKNSGGK